MMAESILEKLFSLKGKVVVLTGGGGFLAGTMAKTIADCGAKVAVLDISKQAAQKVAKEITSAGHDAIALEADVLDKDSLQNACNQVMQNLAESIASSTVLAVINKKRQLQRVCPFSRYPSKIQNGYLI